MNENEKNEFGFSGFDEVVSGEEINQDENKALENDVSLEANGEQNEFSEPTDNTDDVDYKLDKNNFFPSGNYEQENEAPKFVPTYNPYWKDEPQKETKKPKEKKGKHFSFGQLFAVALITAVVVSSCFMAFIKLSDNTPITAPSKSQSDNQTTDKIVEINGSIEELAQVAANKASASVVGVQTTYAVQNFFMGESTSSGSGSGVIYREDGYIITNYHVIADTIDSNNSSIMVFLDNNTENGYKAKVINYNISCDLAVLKIDKTGLNAIELANSDDLNVGQYVVAIGSPGGLEFIGSTTFGIISGLNREIATTDGNMDLIQTDAAINPGNSGGALVNTKGQLIGISSSKLVDESYEGMGFAIPINKVKSICDNLIEHEGEGEAYTGISVSYNYTSQVLKYYGYPTGAVVAGVDADSPADKAGIRRGDIITKFGDTQINEYTQYESALKDYYPNDKVEVSFYRSGKTYTVKLTIGAGN